MSIAHAVNSFTGNIVKAESNKVSKVVPSQISIMQRSINCAG